MAELTKPGKGIYLRCGVWLDDGEPFISRVGEATSSIAASLTTHPVGAGTRRCSRISRSGYGTQGLQPRPNSAFRARRFA